MFEPPPLPPPGYACKMSAQQHMRNLQRYEGKYRHTLQQITLEYKYMTGFFSVEDRKDRKARKEKQIQAKALTALSGTVRPWTLKTS